MKYDDLEKKLRKQFKEIKEDHWRTTVLRRLGLISDFGSRNAGKALEKLLRLPVHLEINTVDLFSPEVITKKICSRNNDKHAVSQSLYGDIPGDVCMIFPRRDALLIADLLLNRPRGETFIMAEVEASVLREVANIMTGSFLTALSIATDLTFLPSVPGEGYPEKLKAFEKADTQEAIFVEVNINVEKINIEADFIFVAEAEGMRLIIGALEEDGEKEAKIIRLMEEKDNLPIDNTRICF